MADDTDVLLKFCEEQWMDAKQAEEQRSTFTNLILVIATAVVGFIAKERLAPEMLPLTILLFLLGLYGYVVTAKLYERHQFHITRAQFWRKRIDELHPNAHLEKVRMSAVAEHEEVYPRMSKVHLHTLWQLLYLAIASAGVILSLIIWINKIPKTP